MRTIAWAALPHCPEGQFQKANPTDAGFDIKIAKDVWVKPYSMLPFEWEDVGLKEELDLPELFDPTNYALFFNPESYHPDLKTKIKFLLTIDPLSGDEIYELLKKLPRVSVIKRSESEFLVDSTEALSPRIHPSVKSIEKVSVLQRKKYKPILVPTGMIVQAGDLSWGALLLRSSMTKYGISMAHGLGLIDYSYDGELLLAIYPISGHTAFKRGEKIAQFVSVRQEEMEGVQVNLSELKQYNRGGFGSTGGMSHAS